VWKEKKYSYKGGMRALRKQAELRKKVMNTGPFEVHFLKAE
jgi:hypothetical protein